MKHFRAIFLVLFVLVVIVIAVQNYDVMSQKVAFKVDLLVFEYQTAGMMLYVMTVIAFLVGVVFAGFYGISERFRLKRQVKTLAKEAKEKDKELNSLRNLPVTTEDDSPVQDPETT
jgi:uncharacterized membrane protein YciS (DUF1049 family)